MECPMTEKKTKRFFPEEFKREAVERVLTSGLPVKQVDFDRASTKRSYGAG